MNRTANTVTLVAAAARLTALVAQDEITAPIRDRLETWSQGAPTGSFKERVTFLVNCTHCTSVWAAAGILVAQKIPGGRALINVLALSQAAITTLALIEMVERQ